MKKLKLFALLAAFCVLASCDGKPSPPDPIDQGFNTMWATISPYIGGVMAIIIGLYLIKIFWNMFFGNDD